MERPTPAPIHHHAAAAAPSPVAGRRRRRSFDKVGLRLRCDAHPVHRSTSQVMSSSNVYPYPPYCCQGCGGNRWLLHLECYHVYCYYCLVSRSAGNCLDCDLVGGRSETGRIKRALPIKVLLRDGWRKKKHVLERDNVNNIERLNAPEVDRIDQSTKQGRAVQSRLSLNKGPKRDLQK